MPKPVLLAAVLLLYSNSIFAQNAEKIHRKAIVIDGHNDVLCSWVIDGADIGKSFPKAQTDVPRWRKGGLDVQFFSVYTGPESRNKLGVYQDAIDQIDSLESLVRRNPNDMVLATNYRQVKKGIRQNKIVGLIGVEGGHMIENDLGKLQQLGGRGMRYLTLTWNNSTPWASSAQDETEGRYSGVSKRDTMYNNPVKKGLNEKGVEIVQLLNKMGVLVDLSHVGEQTFYDAINASGKPVILSHSSVWNICPVFRNVKDEQIKALAKNNGVICINFFSGFVSKKFVDEQERLNGSSGRKTRDSLFQVMNDSVKATEAWRNYRKEKLDPLRPTVAELVDHIDYIVKMVGDRYVGIGSDYDGVSSLPVGMEDVSGYPKITEELLRRGYSKKSIKRILGGNVMRVMKANFL